MKELTIYTKLALAALSLWLLAAAGGCAREDGAGFDGISGSPYRMSITVLAGSTASTRADHTDTTEEAGSAAENYIDFANNDFRIVLFDNAGNYLLELDAANKWILFPSPSNSNYAYYQMECEIEFPESVTKEALERIKAEGLQVMALANWKSPNGQNAYNSLFAANNGHQTLANIWKDGTSYNFGYTCDAGNLSWRPDHTAATKRLIPMFGYSNASKFEMRSNGGILYSSATIQMQRAMAKIEVIDNLTAQPDLSVDGVTMTDFNTSGRFIPDVEANPDWDKIGSQVGKSSLPTGVAQAANLTFFHDQPNKKWVAYVPEMALAKPVFNNNGDLQDSRTHLNVSIKSDLDFYTGDVYPLHFAQYDAKTFLPTIPDDSWNHILRNHIYRFSINKVGIFVQLHLHVIPWDYEEDEIWDFTDHVSISELLKWQSTTDETGNTTPTYEEIDDKGNVFLLLDGTSLVGEFNIKSPLNGRWYARLTPLGDAKTNAVSFVDENGNIIEPAAGDPKACLEISGIIDGLSAQKIYIKPTDSGNDYESTYRLDFFVENLGVWMDVQMSPNPSEFSTYTIVRKANIIEMNL